MRVPLIRSHPSPDFNEGLHLFQLGLYQRAANKFMSALEAMPGDVDALQYLRLSYRRLAPAPKAAPALVWQFRPEQAWEYEWVHLLLGDVIGQEIVDNTWSHVAGPMIVVDNRLVAEKVPYYRRAFEQGARVILLHLSDEAFSDDYGAYRYCEGVIRNCRSDLLAAYSHIFFFPLGFKSGFARPGYQPKPAAARKYLWSFAGDPNKSTRAEMMAAMQRLPDGYKHQVAGFGGAGSLSTADYRALMDDSVVIPCPTGWIALETFRTYEALEAGCIPIVERRDGLDYYAALLGDHPIPTIRTWDEGAALVRRLKADDQLEALRLRCWTWWQDYKARLAADMSTFVKRTLFDVGQ